MKKIAAFLAFTAITCMSAGAFAAGTEISNTQSTTFGTQNTPFKVSSKVALYGKSEDTKYAVAAQHAASKGNAGKGGKFYSTNSVDPSVSEANATDQAVPASCTTDACAY